MTARKKKVLELLAQMSPPECEPRPNSEYHLGFNSARFVYAELKLKVAEEIKKMNF